MTSKNLFNKIASKFIWVLTILCIICASALFFTACSESESEINDPTFSFSDKNDGLISNGSFNYGTSNIDFTTISSLPRVSVTGWSKASSASDVNSGVIDVSEKGWETLVSKLYDDSDFLKYAQTTFGFDKDTEKEALKQTLDREPTSKELKDEIIKKYFSNDSAINYLPNPGTPDGLTDTKIYMLNNYDKDAIGHGLNQNVTSSSTIKLEKGNYGKFTVHIKTQNLKDYNNAGYGAYIALNNTFNSTTQAQYRIQNIVANSGWQKYTIYVKADEVYDTAVTLVLGLGEDEHNAVEGTAFFDNIEFTHVDKAEFDASAIQDTKSMTYGYKNKDVVTNSSSNTYLYDMSLKNYLANSESNTIKDVNSFKKAETVNVSVAKTTSNTGLGNNFGPATVSASNYVATDLDYVIGSDLDGKVLSLDKDSYTVTYTSDSFKVNAESYVYVEFYVKNQLSKFGSTDITFDVFEDFDNNGIKNPKYKSKAVATVNEISDDWVKVGLVLNNNFTTGERKFIIDVVVGPTDVANATTAPDYASGTVTITSPLVASGLISQFNDAQEENDNYNLYSLFKNVANKTLALYAGEQQDFIEDSTSDSYSLNYSASDIGAIVSHPATPINYTGVVHNHVYIMNENVHDSLETHINDRSTTNGKNGSFAGLINTKYISNYTLAGIKSALGFNDGDEDVQPLMIYNANKDSYGYIGTEKSISASSYAKISVDVRVVDDAVAYIYLIDTSDKTKEILTFDKDKVALDTPQEMIFKVTEDMMSDNGWATVTFYIATGANKKDFRIELWNGDRNGDASAQSSGYVFFNNIVTTTAGAFSEPSKVADAFTVSGNPLYDIGYEIEDSIVQYTRKTTELEDKFNKEQTDQSKIISYKPSIIWAKNDTNIYAIFNTIDPVEIDPYENETEEETPSAGCTAQTDPASFWMSFSSIILGVAIALAIIMLIIKNIRRKRKANASDAKSHYKVTSRSRIYKPTKKAEPVDDVVEDDATETVEDEEIIEEVIEETTEDEGETTTEQDEEYIYGDVQDFGDKE